MQEVCPEHSWCVCSTDQTRYIGDDDEPPELDQRCLGIFLERARRRRLQPPRGGKRCETQCWPTWPLCGASLLAIRSHTALAQTQRQGAGSVKDAAGAVTQEARHSDQHSNSVTQTTTSNEEGIFNFPVVSIGQYELDVTASGFTPYKQTSAIKIDVNTSLTIDVTLQVAQDSQTVTVTEGSAEVHTTDTQIGQTIASKQVVDIPLNGRSYTDLLAVQAGVTPVTTSGAGNSSSGGGFGTVPAAGQANPGQFSIHGQRESDNAYYLNGASVQETIGQQAGIIPNLDSIAEFRILSSNVDAEYGASPVASSMW